MAAYKLPRISILLLALSVLPHAAQGLTQTTLTLAASPNPSTFGAPVTLTATVTPSGATGRVTFYDGVVILGTRPLSGGSAAFLTGLLPSGSRKLHAYYAGDASNAAASSNVVAQTVNARPTIGFATGPTPRVSTQIVVGDFNGDGIADLATSNLGSIVTLLGRGDGTFQTIALNPTIFGFPVAVADFNGDGKADLLVQDQDLATGFLYTLLGNGDGTFQTGVKISPATAVVVGDFNGDGKPDLATAAPNGVNILIGVGDGSFQPPALYPSNFLPSVGTTLAVGDFNGDGNADLAAGNQSTVSILLGRGDGTFQAPLTDSALTQATSILVADLNKDGKADLVTLSIRNKVSIQLGNGNGTFQAPIATYTAPLAVAVAVGDFNGDGTPDLAIGNVVVLSASNISFLLGNGDGSFQSPITSQVNAQPFVLISGEFNNDGKTDLLTGGTFLLGTTLSLTASGGTPQSTSVGTAFPTQLQATLRDGVNPVSGASVTFTPTPSAGGASAVLSNSGNAITDASGVARVTATANQIPGSYPVQAVSAGLVATFSLTNTAAPTMILTLVSGTQQSAALGTAFPNPLKVKLTDLAGNPVSGATVTYTLPLSSTTAVLSSGTALTDASGVASVTATAGNITGPYTITASVGLLSVTFTLFNGLASTVTLAASPNPSTLGAPVTLTATVTPSNATGRVTFYDGITVLGTKPLSGGTATFLTRMLPSGPRKLRAYYFGDGTYAAAPPSSVVTQTVNAQPATAFVTKASTLLNAAIPGDFNGDGIADLAVSFLNQSVGVMLGQGDGTFQSIPVNPAFTGVPVAVADFNGDGKADMLVHDQAGNLELLMGNGDGTFQTPIPLGHAALPAVVSDFNGDGKPDIAVGDPNGVMILIGKGDGTFQTGVVYPTGNLSQGITTLAVGDFNGDGKADLAVSIVTNVTILLGRGDGTFQPPQNDPAQTLPSFIAVADLNKDGKQDLVTVSSPNKVSIQLGNGDGTFQAPVTTYAAQAATAAVIGDFNGDGNPDVAIFGAISAKTTNNVSVLLGNGDGTFQPPINYPADFPPFLVAGDFNGDGKTDLLTGGSLLLGATLSLTATGGTLQSTALNAAFPIALQATLKDSAGNPVPGATVTFTAPATGASATLSTSPAVTNASGIASATATANNISGSYTVTASVGTLSVSFPLTNTSTPASISSTGGTPQSVTVGGPFPNALQVTVKDSLGNPVNGVTVNFAAPQTGASATLSNPAAVTNASGVTSVTATANATVGSYTVTASVGALSATFSLTNTSGQAASVTATGGTPQSTLTGAAFANALQATVKDSGGNPVSGVTVVFAAPPTGASATLSSPTAVTNASGIASITATANNIAGGYAITANVGALLASFSLTNTSGLPASVTATGGAPQSTVPGTAFPTALQATVKDSAGNPVSGATVIFAAPPIGASAVLSSPTAVTNASGVASVTATANSIPGSYTVTASIGALSASFLLTNTAALPASITATGGTPQSALLGAAFPNALQATVKDSVGNPMSGVTVTFAAPPTGASTVLSSPTALTNVFGIATVTATANNIAGSYAVTASVGSLSTFFSLTNLQGGSSNLALGKTATQSSTFPGYSTTGPASAVDGNTDGNFANGSVTATNADPNAWWQVDLGASAAVSSIVIWNRTDCCNTRLSDYWVFISDTPFLPTDTPATLQNRSGMFASHQTSAPAPLAVIATNGAQGRYVRVQLTGTDYLSLAEVQVMGTGGTPLSTNLAQGKAATQSSTFPGYAGAGALSAVDGNTDGLFFDASVTATNADPNAWWQVDLGTSATVNSVVVWNRTDCCSSRLGDYWVFISNTPFLPTDTPATLQNRAGTFASHQTSAPNPSTTITANGVPGRYVRVQLTGANYLSLAEVQVFGTAGAPPPNLAMGKVAAQSSTFPEYPTAGAAAAVDGSTDGNFFDGSVTATNLDPNPWWQVDLGASTAVSSVAVWNRNDCCGSRLSDYWVFISDTPFLATDTPAMLQNRPGTFASHQTSAPNPSTTIAAIAQGRYVRVQLTSSNYLSLAEVQVFGQ